MTRQEDESKPTRRIQTKKRLYYKQCFQYKRNLKIINQIKYNKKNILIKKRKIFIFIYYILLTRYLYKNCIKMIVNCHDCFDIAQAIEE